MKKILLAIIIPMTVLIMSCNSSEQNDTKDDMNNSVKKDDSPKANVASANIRKGMESLIGEWRLSKKLRDDNGNHKIDAEEEKNSEVKSSNYMKFNSDGTCKFEEVMDGKYEIITEEDGRKRISIHDLKGSEYPFQLYILSVTEEELVINSVMGGSQFDIYKRP
jgi:uncharacterized protein YxeA